MRPGDRVVPLEHGQGTWRSHGVFDVSHALPTPTSCCAAWAPILGQQGFRRLCVLVQDGRPAGGEALQTAAFGRSWLAAVRACQV